MKKLVQNLSDEEAYSIKYPDPIPDYSNVVQTVKLLLIHEKHHYHVLMEREKNEG